MPNSRGGRQLAAGDPGELLAVEEVARRSQAEGERGHGHEHAVEPAGRQTHGEGHDCTGRTSGEQGEAEVPVPVDHGHRPGDRTHGGEGHLAQRDLSRPAREHDDRTPDYGQDHHGGDLEHAARPSHSGSVTRNASRPTAAPSEASRTSDQPPQGDRHLPHASRERPLLAAAPAAAGRQRQLAEKHPEQHHAGHDRQHQAWVRRPVVVDPPLEGADRHRCQCHHRQIGEPAEGQGGRGADQGGQAEGGIERESDNCRLQEDAEKREHACDHPGQGLQPVDGNAKHRGPVTTVSGGPGGDAEVGESKPQRHRRPAPGATRPPPRRRRRKR